MRIRSRRSVNSALGGLITVLVVLLVLGIVTDMIVFYILFGIILFFSILGVIGLFTFLKKTGQVSSPIRRSTYDIHKGKDYVDEEVAVQESGFCEFCGMKLEAGVKVCSNCGKTSK